MSGLVGLNVDFDPASLVVETFGVDVPVPSGILIDGLLNPSDTGGDVGNGGVPEGVVVVGEVVVGVLVVGEVVGGAVVDGVILGLDKSEGLLGNVEEVLLRGTESVVEPSGCGKKLGRGLRGVISSGV